MAMFDGFKAVGVCGSAGNNSKVVGVVFVGADKVIHDDDRLVCGVVDRIKGIEN